MIIMNLKNIGVWIWVKERLYRLNFRYPAEMPKVAIRMIVMDDICRSAKDGRCVWYGALTIPIRDVTAIYFEE